LARHIGKQIPGNPTVVPQYMTGAGGLRMINYLYNVAPKDGTYIGMIANSFPAMQAPGVAGVQFDAGLMTMDRHPRRWSKPWRSGMKDSEFLTEAEGLNFEVDPVLGEKMQRIVQKVLTTPKDIATKAKGLLE